MFHKVKVNSSVIKSVAYDKYVNVLEITFKSGKVYDYLDVPPSEHLALLFAQSPGRHFSRNIREKYDYALVERG